MKFKLPSMKFSILKLFVVVIALPSFMVLITVCKMQRENHDHKVTHEVFFDIEIEGKPEGRIVIGLFGEALPLTVQNFYTFATTGFQGKKYEGTFFHRVIKKFMIQGGDVVNGDGSGRISIYGDTFRDENFAVHHSTAGFVSMANKGKNTNGCQFFITTLATNWLDGEHVAFGKVVEGQGIVHTIEYLPTDWNDRPVKQVKIARSGARPLPKPYWVSDDPYNLRDWLKTISIPLGMSFAIIFIFSRFINSLDSCIDAQDELIEKEKQIRKQIKNNEKKLLVVEGDKKENREEEEEKEKSKMRKRNVKNVEKK